ncbi:MAG: pilin [Patescibacteria group bacterium]|nr:pilin [Patescibacteria group bacterium]
MASPTDYLGNITTPYTGDYKPDGGLGKFVNNAFTAVVTVAGLAFLLYLIVGGIKYLTSGGDSKAAQSARETITTALIGLVIVTGVWFVALILETVLGISITHPVFTGP